MRRRTWLFNMMLTLSLISIIYAAMVYRAYRTIPSGNTSEIHFDAIVVLGTPSNLDGSVSREQRARVLEAVAEYRRHVADDIIMTGGAAHNPIVEAHTMAIFAESLGVPSNAVLEEGQAHNTIENVFYSMAILRRNGWTSAEIVSSPAHLPRAALILGYWRLAWHAHAAPWPPQDTFVYKAVFYSREALECWRIRTFGFTPNRYLPPSPQARCGCVSRGHLDLFFLKEVAKSRAIN